MSPWRARERGSLERTTIAPAVALRLIRVRFFSIWWWLIPSEAGTNFMGFRKGTRLSFWGRALEEDLMVTGPAGRPSSVTSSGGSSSRRTMGERDRQTVGVREGQRKRERRIRWTPSLSLRCGAHSVAHSVCCGLRNVKDRNAFHSVQNRPLDRRDRFNT